MEQFATISPAAESADDSLDWGSTATVTHPMAAPGLQMFDPTRVMPRTRPLKAYRHFRELLKDKENTEEVFYIFEALPWKGARAAAERFLTTPKGQTIRASEPYLPYLLDDHAALRKLPAGSVAHAYCDFMEREGLSAAGLVAESEKFRSGRYEFNDQFTWYLDRQRDTHDLQHVLTGYGRDALGEQCVLAFTYGQQPSPGHLFIGYLGGLEISRNQRVEVPVLRAVREAQRLGAGCPRITEQPIRDLLALPLDEARRRLNITSTGLYRQAHAVWKANGIDPYDLLGSAKKAA
jgi:ubiquinone biosynthesis protein COQ4